ncbi:MAG: EAL domain-containing protein [Xanthomonadales bacterium]|nr:EAL domain-containing protein [Xanthomonadales bacterium]
MAPNKKDEPLRLILVEDAVEEAERLIGILKTGGIAVRPTRPESLEELAGVLERQQPEILLFDPASSLLPVDEMLERVRSSGREIGVVALLGKVHESEIRAMYELGIFDLAPRDDDRLLREVVLHALARVRNLRALRSLEASLLETERRCENLIDSSRDPIAYIHAGMHVRANQAYLEMFGYEDFEEISGTPVLDLLEGEHASAFRDLLRRIERGEQPPRQLDTVAVRSDGSSFKATLEFSPANYQGEPCLQIIFRQQKVDPELARQLEEFKTRDPVTGLLNRQTLMQRLEEAVAEALRGTGESCLLLVEIDDFRRILQRVGLARTDLLMRDFAELLRSALREGDHAARFTDQSFAALVHGNAELAERLAGEVRRRLAEHIFEVGGQSLTLTVSIGGSVVGPKSGGVAEILGRAEEMLHKAAGQGGNRVLLFDPAAEDKAEAARQEALAAQLEKAILTQGLVPYYQAVVSMSGEITGPAYEISIALAADGGELPASSFIAVAQRKGLLGKIDRWTVRHAVQTAAQLEQNRKPTTFFVRLAMVTVEDPGFVPWLAEKLKEARLGGDALVFELAEADVQVNLKSCKDFVRTLEPLHCGFCITQFGSGLNSTHLFRHLKPTHIKLDRGFVAELGRNPEVTQKVELICHEARAAGAKVIAEHIDTLDKLQDSLGVGVDLVQGFFVHAPSREMNYEF